MRKTQVALLLILFVLIVTCVYQKTSVIYEEQAKLTPSPQKEDNNKSTQTKIDANVVKKIQLTQISHTVTEKKLQAALEKSPMKTASQNILQEENSDAGHKKRIVVIDKKIKPIHSAQAIDTISREKKTVEEFYNTPVKKPFIVITDTKFMQEKVSITQQRRTLHTLITDTQDLKTIDHLMKSLEKNNIAMQRRDKIEAKIEVLIKKALAKRALVRAKIEALIKKALANRITVIQNIEKEEEQLVQIQTELLKTRDALSKKIAKQHKKNTGE